ncbi:MAG: outer membrane protein OmpA-like peptidoglycan-associated protein, partial [Bradymonadia bacterium]
MLRVLCRTLATAVLAFIAIPSAHAQTEGLPMGWGWATTSAGELQFTFEAFDVMDGVVVQIEVGRAEHRFTRSQMPMGDVWAVTVDEPSRSADISVRIDANFAGEAGYLSEEFAMEVLADMDFTVDLDSFDEGSRRFVMTMSQPAGHVELIVRGDSGRIIAERVVQFDGDSPGTPLEVTWSQANESILTLDVKAVGNTGEWSSQQFVPWNVELDPVFILFASGSAEIPDSGVEVLGERLREILATEERIREWVTIKLYVAGYTDTVGNGSDNQGLSESRAQALGEFFRERGVNFEIFYQGFGESALAVPTADSVD